MACAWATLGSYGIMMVISYYLGQKYYPINYNLRSISVFSLLALGLFAISKTYSGIDSKLIIIILNNVLFGVFIYAFYILEFDNLKKIKQISHEN